jgi:hypothetical protein
MVIFGLVIFFVVAAAAAGAVLGDSWLRGRAAYRSLVQERAHLAERQAAPGVMTFSVWTAEHSPGRQANRAAAPLPVAA